MRRLIAFMCGGEILIGSLDEGASTTGLLIVSGGNEVRSGAHRGMALLAARMAATGTSVFRYDRRGIGDSGGINRGYRASRDDLIAATAAFRAAVPQVDRIVGFGNCDAATTLALYGRDAGIAALALANPWMVAQDALPPAAAIRRRYATRLRDPETWRRALTGNVDFRKLARGLGKIAAAPAQADTLAHEVVDAIRGWGSAAHVILAEGDATAIAYADAARRLGLVVRATIIPTASHSFARIGDAAALEAAIRATL